MSERALAQAVGVDQSTLNRFLAGKIEDLSFGVLAKIAHYFEVTVSTLTGESGAEHYDRKIATVMRVMQQLPEERKDAVVAVSTAFLAAADPVPKLAESA